MKTELYDVDYNQYITMLGTAHFTKRSLAEAYEAVRRLQPEDLAIELDWTRFRLLNSMCTSCPHSMACRRRCEFIGAADALGNINANIWLVDMAEQEMRQRMQHWLRQDQWRWQYLSNASVPWHYRRYPSDEVQLWEEGYKNEVLNTYKQRLEKLKKHAPHVWRVLIDERNALMAARLAWIATEQLKTGKQPRILALFGAAHVDGVKKLLSTPKLIKQDLESFKLAFTPPTLIRRIRIEGD